MKAFSCLWQYLAEFFLEWVMFQTSGLVKIKTHISCSVTFFLKSFRLWDWVAADENMTERCMLGEATRAQGRARAPTHTHTTHTHIYRNVYAQYVLLFHSNSVFVNAPQYYVIRTLPVWFFFQTVRPALWPTQPPIHWVPWSLSPHLRWPGLQPVYWPPSTTEVKNEWIYTTAPS